jgi:hypothetical protein
MKITNREIVEMMLDDAKDCRVARAFWRECYVATLANSAAFNEGAGDIADAALVDAVALGMIAGVEL